jgi:putative ABC transport system substrate-binding protein
MAMKQASMDRSPARRHLGRRRFLAGTAAVPFAAMAPGRGCAGTPTVGYLSFNTRQESAPIRDAILDGLADQGFSVPRNLRWLERYADGLPDRVEPLARELLAEGADAIVVNGAATRRTIAVAADRVPVVYGFSGDPMAAGFADSLSRPRGNATGLSLMIVEINAKRIQILKDIAPATRRIALISHPNHPGEAGEVEVCRRTVASLGIDLLYMPVQSREDIDRALAQAAAAAADAVVALPDSITTPNRERIAAWAIAQRVPSASGWAVFAQSGALMTYGPNQRDCYRRVGYFAARVLAGIKPANLPIEQPTRFELVLNLRTARAIGLPLTETQLAQADDMIE